MKTYDISLPISKDLPVWPGDPKVALRQLSSIKDSETSNVSQIRMSVHTGTHIDAPRHFIDTGKTVDQISITKLTGQVLVIEIPENVDVISEDVLVSHPQRGSLEQSSKVLFKTRNSSLWHASETSFKENYVGIDTSGAEFLAKLSLDLIGLDYLSIAPYKDTIRPHLILLEKEIVLLEGIDLSKVKEGEYVLFCLPLLISGCEGSPARAILMA
jgi:arylformamidase